MLTLPSGARVVVVRALWPGGQLVVTAWAAGQSEFSQAWHEAA